jgi:hypothetical protein
VAERAAKTGARSFAAASAVCDHCLSDSGRSLRRLDHETRQLLWVGGPLPLGYAIKDGKIAVVQDEAERVSGSATSVEQIAVRQKCSVRQLNMTISLAFLVPDLVKAAVEGRLPRGIGVERLGWYPEFAKRAVIAGYIQNLGNWLI